MAEHVIEIAVPLIPLDRHDCADCIERLQAQVQTHRGIVRAHLHTDHQPQDLCIHYDANIVTPAAVKRIALSAGAELKSTYQHEEIRFSGLNTADAAQTLERELEQMPGMLHASVNYAAGLAFVAYDPKRLGAEQVHRAMRRLGARVTERARTPGSGQPEEEAAHHHEGAPAFLPHWLQERWGLALVLLGGLLLLAGWAGARWLGLPPAAATALYLLSCAVSGYDTARHALPALLRGKFDTDTLMLAAAAGAGFLGHWAEGAFLLFLFGLGHAAEHYALDRARNAIHALGDLMPKTARVRRGEAIEEEPVAGLAVGDVVLVPPGERVPVDGDVLAGRSAVDQSPITGESLPVEKGPGDSVFAGTINSQAALDVTVTRLAQDTTLSRVLQMVAEAQAQQSPTQQITGRFTAIFVPAVLALTVLVAALPPLLGWLPFEQSFYRAMLLLVAASPCALAVGTPAAVLAGIARAARSGVLIKGGLHLENLGGLQVLAFDKTGTLTEGRFAVTEILPAAGVSNDELLAAAAAAEQHSSHPLAQAVVRAAQGLDLPAAQAVENVPGLGLRALLDGEPLWIGAPRLFDDDSPPPEDLLQAVARVQETGATSMIVRRGNTYLGLLALADTLRPNTAAVLARLKALGVRHLVLLTGDNAAAARRVALAAGLTDVRAGLLPGDKLTAIQAIQRQYGAVAMVGDGVNDAPALATATVGVAMGGAGTAAALETADVALMADDLGTLPFALGLSRATRAVIRQNLAIALAVIALLIVVSVLGLVELGWAVVAHEGSTVLVALNALRLLGYRLPLQAAAVTAG